MTISKLIKILQGNQDYIVGSIKLVQAISLNLYIEQNLNYKTFLPLLSSIKPIDRWKINKTLNSNQTKCYF